MELFFDRAGELPPDPLALALKSGLFASGLLIKLALVIAAEAFHADRLSEPLSLGFSFSGLL